MSLSAFDPDGPAVSLADSSSIFPHQLANEWRRRGLPVAIVTSQTSGGGPADRVPVVQSQPFERSIERVARRLTKPVARRIEKWLPRWQRSRYERRTGRPRPESWEWRWVDHGWDSFARARAALSLRPRFVFAHEVSSYGLSGALCHGVPRILFPWGGDVFNYVESSIALEGIMTYALRRADLVVPSSVVAAQHIRDRFALSEDTVKALSWGVDLKQFARSPAAFRDDFCRKLGVDSATVLVLNSRRFRPLWGSALALEGFLGLAARRGDVHFLLLSGSEDAEHVRAAEQRVAAAGLGARFTFIEPNVPLSRCAEIMSVSDVFVSLMGRGDMRSASVLQGTACGGAPVILEAPEYRAMTAQGFACEFVQPDDADGLVAVLDALASDATRRAAMRERNDRYVREHEDYDRQMTRLLDLIGEASRPYRERAKD